MPEVNSQDSKKSTPRFVISIRQRITIPLKLTAERNDVVVLCFHFNAFRLALISNVKPGAFWDSCFEIYSQSTAGIDINNIPVTRVSTVVVINNDISQNLL